MYTQNLISISKIVYQNAAYSPIIEKDVLPFTNKVWDKLKNAGINLKCIKLTPNFNDHRIINISVYGNKGLLYEFSCYFNQGRGKIINMNAGKISSSEYTALVSLAGAIFAYRKREKLRTLLGLYKVPILDSCLKKNRAF